MRQENVAESGTCNKSRLRQVRTTNLCRRRGQSVGRSTGEDGVEWYVLDFVREEQVSPKSRPCQCSKRRKKTLLRP